MLESNEPEILNVQRIENEVTYKPEKDSPWGTFTFPIKDTTYTIHALPNQEASYLVEWEIKVSIHDVYQEVGKVKYAEGIIAVYDHFRGTFKVSALDDGTYIFKAKNHGWVVRTFIKK